MPATTTLATLLSDLAEELDLGLVLDDASATTTVITETTTGTSELRGPFTGLKIPVGSPVTVITGTAGEDTFVSSTSPSAGTLTLSPAITTGSTKFIIWKPVVKHGKNIEKAISRANQKCRRWQKVPLTFIPDGEMLAATIADYWTAGAGTATYQSLATPEMYGRVIQISHSSTTTLTGNTIPARAGEVWRFETAIRATTDGDTAALTFRDVLAGADITLTFDVGDGSTTSRAFVTQKGYFTVPGDEDTDARIAPRLTVSGSGTMTAQMAPLIAYPQDAMSFPFTNRVLSDDRIGNFYYARGYGENGGPDERGYTEPITTGGCTHTFSNDGDHLVVSFNFTPGGPVYYDELIYGAALTSLTDTTTFPAEQVKRWSRAEIYKWLLRAGMAEGKRAENGVFLPSEWRDLYNNAAREARWSLSEPTLLTVVGRR